MVSSASDNVSGNMQVAVQMKLQVTMWMAMQVTVQMKMQDVSVSSFSASGSLVIANCANDLFVGLFVIFID